MAATLSGAASTSVCATFTPGQYPGTLQRATHVFGCFGDIVRIDMTLGSNTGRLLVTFFDVRAAEQVVKEFQGRAEFYPPAAHDFRAVSISAKLFAELPPTFSGFQTFGEISGVSISGEDMVVEFYDMRAAQQVAFSVPGCRPRKATLAPNVPSAVPEAPPAPAASNVDVTAAAAAAVAAAAMAAAAMPVHGLYNPALLYSLSESLARVEYELGAVAAATRAGGGVGANAAPQQIPISEHMMGQPHGAHRGATLGQPLTPPQGSALPQQAFLLHPPGLTLGCPLGALAGGEPAKVPVPATSAKPQQPHQQPQLQQQHQQQHQQQAAAAAPAAVPVPPGPRPAPGKPVREKVSSKDLTKFDIVPDKIQSGEDTRTTVMVRNIPKVCSRENFVELLGQCGLGDRYTFFYMPFDKRRNIHCGFAFVNFKSHLDVLQLHEGILGFLTSSGAAVATPPAMSYARLQGQEQLMKHFSLSAVMYDHDARKRPLFCRGSQLGQDAAVVDHLQAMYLSAAESKDSDLNGSEALFESGLGA